MSQNWVWRSTELSVFYSYTLFGCFAMQYIFIFTQMTLSYIVVIENNMIINRSDWDPLE